MIYKSLVKKVSIPVEKKTKQKEYLESGRLPIVDQGKELIGGYTDDVNNALDCNLPVIVFGDHTKAVKYINFPFGAGADGIKVLEPKEEILPKYLYYGTHYLTFKIVDKGYARHYQHIEKKDLPVPPLEDQHRIVTRIDELFSQLDSGVETLKKTKEQLKVYRQAVLKEAFEGDYTKVKLNEISTAISGYAFKSKEYTSDGSYIVIKIGNVKPFHFDFSRDCTKTNEVNESIISKYLLKKGDCLITLTGSRGKRDYGYISMITDQNNFLLNQRVAALRFNQTKAYPLFYEYYLSSIDYQNQFFAFETGNVGQGNVGIKALTEPYVIAPSINEQKRIVNEIESRLSVCDSIDNTIDTALQESEALRQSILKQAFEGGV